MYKIVDKVYDGKIFYGYGLYDLESNREFDADINSVKIYVAQGWVQDVGINNKGKLHNISKLLDLRKLNHRQIYKNKLSTFLVGEALKKECSKAALYNTRYCFNTLINYISGTSNKVFMIYGLRRTGKTTIIHQAINYLGYIGCAYISLNKNDKSIDLLETLDYCLNSGYKYVFIDEITELNDILYFIATLADKYVTLGMKIIISGADSYKLALASNSALYDRYEGVKTTYISFKEYNMLLGATDIEKYIELGGVLKQDAFYNESETHKYLTTSISENIEHTIDMVGRQQFGKLHDLIGMGLFKRYLELAIQHTNEELTANIIAEEYKSRDVGSVKQLLESTLDLDPLLELDDITEQIRYALRVSNIGGDSESNRHMAEEFFDTFIDIFNALDLVVYSKHYYVHSNRKMSENEHIIFTLAGLRFNQLKETIIAFMKDAKFQGLSKNDRNIIKNKLISDVYGQLAEQLILVELMASFGKERVYKLNDFRGREIDCVVEVNDSEIDLIEVKWNDKCIKQQCNNLVNHEFVELIEERTGYKIRNRIVIYRGENTNKFLDDYIIHYININKFLLDTHKY